MKKLLIQTVIVILVSTVLNQNVFALSLDELRARAESTVEEGNARSDASSLVDEAGAGVDEVTGEDHGWEDGSELDTDTSDWNPPPVPPAYNPADDVPASETGLFQNNGTSRVIAPRIPKPETLPGPVVNDAENMHERYFITNLIPSLVRVGINLLVAITVVALMISGIQYLTAYGEDSRIEAAKKNITYSLIGLFIALFSYTIVSIISNVPLSNRDAQQQIEQDTTEFNNQVSTST